MIRVHLVHTQVVEYSQDFGWRYYGPFGRSIGVNRTPQLELTSPKRITPALVARRRTGEVARKG
jgi:hypothetical protein